MTLLCCFTGASAVTVSLRHLYVRADELSLPTSEEGVKMGGSRDADSKHAERERERETRWVLPPLTHTHTRASLSSSSSRTERASFPHPLQENKTAFSFQWIIEDLARFYVIQHNQRLRHRRGTWAAGTQRGSGRILQHQGQRPWLQWWRRGLSSVSPKPLPIPPHIQP